MQQGHFHSLLKKCCIAVALATSLQAYSSTSAQSSDEEAFLIRRIAEFWKDGDYGIVKAQIHEFVKKYPHSAMKDYLNGILADLLLQENQYEQALSLYITITDANIHEKILLNKLQCYYELGKYEPLSKEGEPYLTAHNFGERQNEYAFLMAESYFRYAITLTDEATTKPFLEKAQPLYETLSHTDYEDVSSFALAEIYRLLKQNAKGVDLYLSLAEKHPSKKEALLFNAALLEAQIDKQNAIEIFNRVIAMNGSKSGDASFNRLLLYFQTQQYEQVVNQHRLVYPYVPSTQMTAFNFIIGKSFYALQDYENAITPLEKFILEQKVPTNQYKDALLIQMTCAKNTENESLFDKTLSRFKTSYPDDLELGKAFFMHAMILKKEEQFDKAEQALTYIFSNYPAFEDKESLLYEYAIVTHHNGKYKISYDTLQNLLKDFPESPRKDSAWRYFLSSCLHLSKSSGVAAPTSTDYSKDRFLSDLQNILTHKSGLSEDEVREYRLLYAKLAYELTYYNNALEVLTGYLKEYPKHDTLAEAHLLTGLCLNKLQVDPEQFCMHLETALQLNPELQNTSAIHLQLYNAYLTRSLSSSQPNQGFIDQAACHLYAALQDPSQAVKSENKLWLASYYYKQAKDYLDQHWTHAPGDNREVAQEIDRSLDLYNQAISSEKVALLPITQQTLNLEPEALKFAELLGVKNYHNKKAAVLQALIEQQNNHPDWAWQFKRHAVFELATTYEYLNDLQAALETYEFINEFPSIATPLTIASAFKSAKIKFDLLDRKCKNEKNPEVIAILNQLKDVQIRKNALSEPIHLEAGIEYAKIRAALSQDSMKESRYLFFLVRLKEDFTTSEDPVTSEYLSSLKKNTSQENLYTAYMKFIDAEILRMQSKHLHSENKKEDAMQHKQKALALLHDIENSKAPTEYLHSEVIKSIKLLR